MSFSFAKVGAKMDAALEKIAPKVAPFFTKIGKALFPVKGDAPREIIRKVVFFVCAVVLVVASVMLVDETLLAPAAYQSEVENLKDIFLPERGEQGTPDNPDGGTTDITDVPKEEVIRGLKELRALNPDTFGWITFHSTGKYIGMNIDYPVMQGEDNDYYLNRTFYKKKNKAGSLFLDYRNNFTAESRDKISIIYGHNLSTGLMFSKLNKLVDNLYNARQATHFTLTTDAGTETYVLFAVMLVNTKKEQGPTFNYMKYDINTESAFDRYVYEVRRRSMYDYNTEVTFEDSILALSTCVPHRKNYGDGCRAVVLARPLREGEKLNVKLSTNADCLYPLSYYQQNELPIPAEYANIGNPSTTTTTSNSGVVIQPTGSGDPTGSVTLPSSGASTNKTSTNSTNKTNTTLGSGSTGTTAPSGTTPTSPSTPSGATTVPSGTTQSGVTTAPSGTTPTSPSAPSGDVTDPSTPSGDVTDSTAPSDSTTPSSDSTDPSVTEPSESQPSESEPSESQPSETEPSETQPSESQPSETEPSETEPSETTPSETEPSETAPSETDASAAA